MCGIAGFIGESKKPILTYQLITKLFEKSESRGIDAAGYWGTESGDKGKVLYHKEPCKASNFVKKDMWKQVCGHNPNLLLVHTRGASKGVGEPSVNYNNHPHTSLDKSIGLIHNGRVDDVEYNTLKQKYSIVSQCDSEILLRIFESGETYSPQELQKSFGSADKPERLAGIRDVFSLINEGHMAVAVGERGEDGSRMMWLFRNRYRPLWVIDMREPLGQVFFVSEPSIWEEAVDSCSGIKSLTRTQKLIELPTEEIWYFKINTEQICPKNVQRYEVCREETLSPWEYDGKKIDLQKRSVQFEVVTRLDSKDQIIPLHKPKPLPQVIKFEEEEPFEKEDMEDEFLLRDVEKKCDEIIDLVNNIKTYAEQLVNEQSVQIHDMEELLQSLELQRQDLEGLSLIINR